MQPSDFYWCRVRKNRMMNNKVNGAENIFFFNWWWFTGVLYFMFITCICHTDPHIPKQKSPRQVPFLSLLCLLFFPIFQNNPSLPKDLFSLHLLIIILTFIRYCFILYYFVLYFILYYISLLFNQFTPFDDKIHVPIVLYLTLFYPFSDFLSLHSQRLETTPP